MRILVDTNVLVRMVHFKHPHQAVADGALSRLRDENHELRTVPQVPYEFWAVASRPIPHNGLELSKSAIYSLLDQWRLLFPPLRLTFGDRSRLTAM
jgi:hypothetical protein